MPLCNVMLVNVQCSCLPVIVALFKVVAAGGGAAAGSIAGPLGTLGGAVVSWFLLC